MVTKQDINLVDDLIQKLIDKLQILGVDTSKLEDVCYDILYKLESKEKQ